MTRENKDALLERLREGAELNGSKRLKLAFLLALPAILAQFASVLMQYIDSAMVGRLGANPAASIGLVSSSIWILNGFYMAVITGFSVQVAHACGAKNGVRARLMLKQGLLCVFLFSVLLSAFALSISGVLPGWLGGDDAIRSDASSYFLIIAAFLPISATGLAAASMLQASGDMKVPSIVYICMGVLDVIFNYVFIYGLGLGVVGAAWGTCCAESLATLFVIWYVTTQSKELKSRGEGGSWLPSGTTVKTAFGITGPLWLQNIVMRGAYVMSTVIVAPLGPVSIAANSFAITAESFCFMPGYGLEEASTTLVGQSIGARRKELARSFARITIGMAVLIMVTLAVIMFAFAPQLMGIMSIDDEVISLGARVLPIVAVVEGFNALAIVGSGVCAGAGQTLVPTIINFSSMWLVRIVLALILTPVMGLVGYWIAMSVELTVRGIAFAVYLKTGHWMNKQIPR